MDEKTEAKDQELKEMLHRRLAEQSHDFARQLEMVRADSKGRLEELKENFEDRKKELLAQNDGLLGAVGRLHTENEDLRKKISVLEPALLKAKEETECAKQHADVEVREAHRRYDEMAIRIRNEAEAEIKRFKEKLAECQGRKKGKA